jgi:hypothetical protein
MIRGLGKYQGRRNEHMGSDSIGNDALVDTVRGCDGILSMESANSRLEKS